MKIEVMLKKKSGVSLMNKRNKRTEIKAHMELAPFTEQVLAQMGQEGATIRKRLQIFYRQRTCQHDCRGEECREHSS